MYNVPVQVKQKESETKIMIVWNFIWQWKTAHLIYDKNILKRVSKIHVDMKRVNTESLISICHAFHPFLPFLVTFSSLYYVTLTFFLETLTSYALCYDSDSFWWAETLNVICLKKNTTKFISEMLATIKKIFDESTQSPTRLFRSHTKTVERSFLPSDLPATSTIEFTPQFSRYWF